VAKNLRFLTASLNDQLISDNFFLERWLRISIVLIDRHTIDWLCDSHRNKDFNG